MTLFGEGECMVFYGFVVGGFFNIVPITITLLDL